MQQPLLMGLMAGLFALTTAILTLIGVLVATKSSFKLGKRSGDVQQQSADTTRIEQLVGETEALRKEIRALWADNTDLRHKFEMAEKGHEGERDLWAAERRTLTDRQEAEKSATTERHQAEKSATTERHQAEKLAMIDHAAAELRQVATETVSLRAENADLRQKLAETATQMGRTQAELEAAVRGQAQSEAALSQARRTITEKLHGSEDNCSEDNCLEDKGKTL